MTGSLRLLAWTFLTVAIVMATAWVGPSLAGEHGDQILTELRIPRALAGALVGAVLAAAGAVVQVLLQNPLGLKVGEDQREDAGERYCIDYVHHQLQRV